MQSPAALVATFLYGNLPDSSHAGEQLLALKDQATQPLIELLNNDALPTIKRIELLGLLAEFNDNDVIFDAVFFEAQRVYLDFNFRNSEEVMYLRELIDALARYNRPQIFRFLYRCLHYPHDEVKMAAIRTLDQLNEKCSVPHLQLCLTDSNAKIRRLAAQTIQKYTGEIPIYRGVWLDRLLQYTKLYLSFNKAR